MTSPKRHDRYRNVAPLRTTDPSALCERCFRRKATDQHKHPTTKARLRLCIACHRAIHPTMKLRWED